MMSPILLSIKLIIWKKPVLLETVLNALVFHYLIFFFLMLCRCSRRSRFEDLVFISRWKRGRNMFCNEQILESLPVRTRLINGWFSFQGCWQFSGSSSVMGKLIFSHGYAKRRNDYCWVRICKFVTHSGVNKSICQRQTDWYRLS